MGRYLCFLYGVAAYVLFLATFCYTIGFTENLVVPKNINQGTEGPVRLAILVNVLLLGLFAAQHAIMARPWFKQRWTKIVPQPIERSTFVLATCIAFGLLFWFWRPMLTPVWQVEHSVARPAMFALSFAGYGLVLYASFLIDHFDLFGLRQVFMHLRCRKVEHGKFVTPTLYKFVRNPLMLGFLIAFWATPNMTQGHLLFVSVTTAYVFFGVWLEERDLLRALGEDYRRYRARTPMLVPLPRFGQAEGVTSQVEER